MAKKYKKRADGRYATTVVSHEINPKTGKKKPIPVYGRTIRELEENKARTKNEVEKGIYTSQRQILFREYKWEWFETYKSTKHHNTKEGYANILKNHTGTLDALPLKAIRKSDVQKGYNALKGHEDLQRRYKQTVNQILKSAIDDGYIFINAAANIETDRRKRKKKRALTTIERRAIPKAELTLKQRCFVSLLQYTGMRREEIVPLEKKDIDFARHQISVCKAVEFIGEEPNLKGTKSFAGIRMIPILEPLEGVLKEYVDSLDGKLLFPRKDEDDYLTKSQYRTLFTAVKRKINTAAGGSHKWVNGKTVFTRDLCKGLSSHVFRHEFATILYYSGVDLLDAIEIFGHADVQEMLDVYVELRSKTEDNAEKINAYLRNEYITEREK